MSLSRPAALLLLSLLLSCDFHPPGLPPPSGREAAAPLGTTSLRLASGRELQVEVARTPAERERGLMFRRELPPDYGMLFVFPQQMDLQFWMKNTFVSLDIIYIDSAKTVTRVHARVKASTPRTRDEDVARVGGYGQYVLELPAGAARLYGIELGQKLKFDIPIPPK